VSLSDDGNILESCEICKRRSPEIERCVICGLRLCPDHQQQCYSCKQIVCPECAGEARDATGEIRITACTEACVENFRADNKAKLEASHRKIALELRKRGIVKPVFQGRFFTGTN
jgi:methionyl-tRNA synthetase